VQIAATVKNRPGQHDATVRTGTTTQSVAIAAKAAGGGSAINGGELLMLALATCYCNDLYREAQRLGIVVDGVEVEASAEFAGVGLAARNIRYRATVSSPAPPDAIATLLRETDAVAEIHNTLRAGAAVTLEPDLERRGKKPADPA
jgi:uncharacterized OsmC-like protein